MIEQTPPWDVLERLREIDPDADLLYIGEGRWILGVYRPGEPRRLFARKQLRTLSAENPDDADLEPWAVVAKYKKIADGFAPVFIGEAPNGLFGELIHDFRVSDWFYRNQADAQFERNLEASDIHHAMDDRKATMADYADSEAGPVWRYTHRKPVSRIQESRPW
jgi:hypothetical protein